MRDTFFLIVLIVVAFVFGYYIRGLRTVPPATKIIYDTVTVTQAKPVYYTKYITKSADTVQTLDTIYVASIDTTIGDIQVKVEYESQIASTGSFNISAITTKSVYVPPDYYIELVGFNSFVVPLKSITLGAGRYLVRGSHISLGIGGYVTYYHASPYNLKYDYGLQFNAKYEF